MTWEALVHSRARSFKNWKKISLDVHVPKRGSWATEGSDLGYLISRWKLNGFQSSVKLPPALATGRGIQKRFGMKLPQGLQESYLCKKNFYFTSIQGSSLIRLGLHAHLESRYVITLNVLCSSRHPCRVLYMKGASGILKFLKAPVQN
uniref:Uncharacterized protein n=1 Tax=Pipistrellus kuhlii TaxID=59472 RepID=A0A7J7YM98_PIPKU|nr:hypothetical protein mPipKuh1_010110 [Pipistrellus kuhlii]